MVKTVLVPLVGLAALVLNPLFACESRTEFEYTDADMRSAVEGTWKIALPAHDATSARAFTITIRQGTQTKIHSERAHLVRDAAACGQRSFVRNAGACMDYSEMPLEVAVLETPDPGAYGSFMVLGTAFMDGNGILRLDLTHTTLETKVSPHGVVSDVTSYDRVADPATSYDRIANPRPATMVRIAAPGG